MISKLFKFYLVTTLQPQLGTIEYDDKRTVSIYIQILLLKFISNNYLFHKLLSNLFRF